MGGVRCSRRAPLTAGYCEGLTAVFPLRGTLAVPGAPGLARYASREWLRISARPEYLIARRGVIWLW